MPCLRSLLATRCPVSDLDSSTPQIAIRFCPRIFFGDSRAAEWPAPQQLKNVTVINRGIGGQTSAQAIGRFQEHVAGLRPDIILLQLGVNDLKTIPLFPEQREAIVQNCQTNIGRLVQLSLKNGARVIVTTIFPLGAVPMKRRPFWSDDVATAIKEVNVYIASLASDRVVVFDTARVLANPQGTVASQYRRDLLHLSPAGYAALNQAMGDTLVPLLHQNTNSVKP
jgi:lysophospholipase L1-like esterase